MKWKLIYANPVIFLFLTGLLVVFSCRNELSDIERIAPKEDANKEIARDVTLLYSDSSVVRVKIEGPTLVRHLDPADPREEFPDGLKVNFFGHGKKVSSVLTSRFAVRYENKQKIFVRDSVVWISNAGEKLETEELVWDEKSKKVYSTHYVLITNKEETIFGLGFESNEDFSEWTIRHPEGKVNVNQ